MDGNIVLLTACGKMGVILKRKPYICKPCLQILNCFYTGGFFSLQILSSIILIASHLYGLVHGKANYHIMWKLSDWVILDSALQVVFYHIVMVGSLLYGQYC